MKSAIFTQRKAETRMGVRRFFPVLFTAFSFCFSLGLQAQDVLVGLTSNGGPEGKGTAYSFKPSTKTFTVMRSFANWGENPTGSLVRGTDGYLYGMTPNGGTYGYGTLFRVASNGTDMTILKHFDGENDGGYPKGGLIQAKDGLFYGMTTSGPNSGGGAIFKISPTTGQYTIIKAFNINTDGGHPYGNLVQAADGNFYGITRTGGGNGSGAGTIFKLTTSGTYSVMKVLNGTTEGGGCYGSLMQGSDGAFYGMTYSGGTYGYGVIFRFSTTQGYKVLKHFNRAVDAAYPMGDLIQAKDGYLYGLATSGIGYNGVAFRIKMDGTSFKLLHQFAPGTEGGNPYGSLVQGTDGYFYGTVTAVSGYSGGIFKMNTSGTASSVKKFTAATDGEGPSGTLIQLPDGLFYGTAQYGGKYAKGTIFKVKSGSYSVLTHLNGSGSGSEPMENLTLGKDSAYYGVTYSGGTYNYGTIFKICGGVTTILRSLNRSTDGGNPSGGLVRGRDGNLYGTTEAGGSKSYGTIFKITPSGTFTVLRHLNGTTDGQSPRGMLALGAATDSSIYGITYGGGTTGGGTIFKITPKGTFTVLRNLSYSTDGDHSESGLVYKDGAFYGITSNNARFFKITPAGQFTVIKTLVYGTDGGYPMGNMILGTDGFFYGTLSLGGTYGYGTIVKISTAGAITKLRHFNGTTDGGSPKGSLVMGTDGYLYGTTSRGGTNKVGTLFKIGTTGSSFSVLRNFNITTDGGTPLAGLILAPKLGTLAAKAQSGLTTNEDVAKAITLTGTGATNLTFNIAIKPRNGTVSDGTGAARTYTPRANFYGVDSFAFTANVGCLASTIAWVKITVASVNDAPVLASIGNKSLVKGTALTFIATATDADPGQTKTFSLIGAPSGATINATTGSFSWTPTTTGTFTFKVRVTDNGSPVLYDEESITVTVTATALTAQEEAVTVNKPVAETPAIATASLYPNPVRSQFVVTLAAPADQATVVIVDAKGSVVYTKKQAVSGKQFSVNAASLKAGAYLIQVQTTTGMETLRFVKL